ncbi:MAG TPA: ABC-type transport auxiliary lipoprotein family protein [Terriglobia bacterium]|nr:ABC-type transport auxiliary lipoprotein family protein [Terriglobia bacterium]
MKSVVSQLKDLRSRSRRPKTAGLVLLAALLCTACGSSPKTRYYTLGIPQPPAAEAPGTHFTLQVERFDAPDLLLDNRLIYYTSPTELNFDEYHRWSSDPGELLSDMAMKFFAKTGLFQQVYAFPAPVKVDYTLRGRVLDLSELKYETAGRKSGEVRLGLKLDLLETRQNAVVWSSRLEQTEPLQKSDVQGAIEAMNAAAERLLHNAYGGISQALERENTQKQQ